MLSKLVNMVGSRIDAFVCARVGHVPSWVLGAAYGFRRPVCERCKEVLDARP